MAWITGWEIAAAVSNAGGLGTIASAILKPEEIIDEIRQIKQATDRPFAINIPIRLAGSKEAIEVAIAEEVPVVVTSTGDPMIYTERLHKAAKRENSIPPIRIRKTIAVVFPDSRRALLKFFQVNRLIARPKIRAPAQPMPPASVGVNIPA